MPDIIINIYIGVNLFLTGVLFSDEYNPNSTRRESIHYIFKCLSTLMFGCIFIIFKVVSKPFKLISNYFQISFWFQYYLTKKWDNLPEEQLESLNWYVFNIKNTNSLHHKISRYGARLINKRNNYTYINKI